MQISEWPSVLFLAAWVVLQHPITLWILRRRDRKAEATRAIVVNASGAHQSYIEEKRLQGIDALWGAVVVLRGYGRGRADLLASNMVSEASLEQRQALAEGLALSAGEDVFRAEPAVVQAQRSQPWIPSHAWDIYATYEVIIGRVLGTYSVLAKGKDPKDILRNKETVEELLLSLNEKECQRFIPYGDKVVPSLLVYLESSLLSEISLALSGEATDRAVAARIGRSAALARRLGTG